MGQILQDQYSKAFSNPNAIDLDDFPIQETTLHGSEISDIEMSVEDFISAIDELNSSSAGGPDKVPAIILKECKLQLALIFLRLWRKSIDNSDIASIFRLQCIIAIFKNGNKSDAENYRPVSLTSHIIKIFERVIRKALVAFIETNNLLNTNQYGFRNGRSCLTQLLSHIDNIMTDLSNDCNADVMYLDFSKAFDKVDHRILLRKLYNFGIRGKLHKWITCFLSGRKQFVLIDGKKSITIDVTSGVIQGTVLGPLFFLLYINDMFEVVKNSILKVFADDSKLHKLLKTLLDRILLEDDLNAIVKWSKKNNMELNTTMFQLLQYGKNVSLKQPYTLPDGTVLEASEYVKEYMPM